MGNYFLIKTIYKKLTNPHKRKLIKLIAKFNGGEAWSPLIRRLFKDIHNIHIGIGSYGGCFEHTKIPRGTSIGKYCSFAPNVHIYNGDHPKNFITTHPIIYNPVFNFVKKESITRTKIEIGHDVWIGQNAIITSKVSKIGNGAIIGAGSVVTKNVNDYEIVAGSPAKVIGYRFSEDEINKLNEIEWWNWDKEAIRENIDIFQDSKKFMELFK
ncbi:CatB-related O-acetyltransferase [Bacillus sp. FJAT-29814]|uniref:CatB-related O-acetyltransferase n=1 Tax=Bacillus sp. FJAT-29814 TaxID=1729688 RepID=UPI000832091C|nr:CatB-related O-acetyltransferase [Bacillus sp. FJAT-29814]